MNEDKDTRMVYCPKCKEPLDFLDLVIEVTNKIKKDKELSRERPARQFAEIDTVTRSYKKMQRVLSVKS